MTNLSRTCLSLPVHWPHAAVRHGRAQGALKRFPLISRQTSRLVMAGLVGSPRKLPYTFDPIEGGRDALRLANAFRDGKDTLLARPSSMRRRMVSQATSSSHHA